MLYGSGDGHLIALSDDDLLTQLRKPVHANMNSFTKPEVNGGAAFSMVTHLKTSKPESERDSGYSDAGSEYLSAVDLTDSEDTGRSVSAVNQEQTSSQVASMGGSYSGLSPMIILNNFILKQTDPVVPAAKQFGFPSSVEMMPQSSQVVLLQPMVPNASSSSLKAASENHKESKNRPPVLKSYPKIAPHPGEGTPPKRHGAFAVRGGSRPACEQRHRRHHHGCRPHSSPSHRPGPQTPVKNISSVEAAITPAQTADCQELCLSQPVSPDFKSGLLIDRWQGEEHQDVFTEGGNTKRQRFSNTYNILKTSGLLGITLRTKQLIKENRRTQSQLHQLREHTALLTEALSSGDPQLWTKLQFALQEKDTSQ